MALSLVKFSTYYQRRMNEKMPLLYTSKIETVFCARCCLSWSKIWFPSSRVCQNFEFWNAKAIWYFLANCCNFTQDVALRVSDYYYNKCIRYQVSPLFIFIPKFLYLGTLVCSRFSTKTCRRYEALYQILWLPQIYTLHDASSRWLWPLIGLTIAHGTPLPF